MMEKRDYVDFQHRTQPLAFLITYRCYGTWLHGDKRGSVDRRKFHRHGTPAMPANKRLAEDETLELKHAAVTLDKAQRVVVEDAIREVCDHVDMVFWR